MSLQSSASARRRRRSAASQPRSSTSQSSPREARPHSCCPARAPAPRAARRAACARRPGVLGRREHVGQSDVGAGERGVALDRLAEVHAASANPAGAAAWPRTGDAGRGRTPADPPAGAPPLRRAGRPEAQRRDHLTPDIAAIAALRPPVDRTTSTKHSTIRGAQQPRHAHPPTPCRIVPTQHRGRSQARGDDPAVRDALRREDHRGRVRDTKLRHAGELPHQLVRHPLRQVGLSPASPTDVNGMNAIASRGSRRDDARGRRGAARLGIAVPNAPSAPAAPIAGTPSTSPMRRGPRERLAAGHRRVRGTQREQQLLGARRAAREIFLQAARDHVASAEGTSGRDASTRTGESCRTA